jgi:hypothetical protein
MKHLLSIPMILVFAATCASAQVRNEETITTTDTTGRTTTVSVTTISKTEDITPRTDVILMSPFEFLRYYNISYLHSISPNMAVGGGFRLAHDLSDEFDAPISFGLTLEGRFYPGKKGVKGFYLAPNAAVSWLSETYSVQDWDPQTGRTNWHENSVTGMAFTIGLMSGWQFFPWEEMTMGVGLGFEHNILATSSTVTIGTDQYEPFFDFNGRTLPAVRFDIGYAW